MEYVDRDLVFVRDPIGAQLLVWACVRILTNIVITVVSQDASNCFKSSMLAEAYCIHRVMLLDYYLEDTYECCQN